MQQKFPRMSDGHAWKTSKLEESCKKTKHVLGLAWIFFLRTKNKLEKKKNHMFIVLEWNIFSTFFFLVKKYSIKVRWTWLGIFFTKKKKSEKNTHACLVNMRGSLPLLKGIRLSGVPPIMPIKTQKHEKKDKIDLQIYVYQGSPL